MRSSFHPQIIRDDEGAIVCIATGADATSEHEQGSAELMTALTGLPHPMKKDVAAALKRARAQDPSSPYPDLMASRRIPAGAKALRFEQWDEDGEPTAVMYAEHRRCASSSGDEPKALRDDKYKLGQLGFMPAYEAPPRGRKAPAPTADELQSHRDKSTVSAAWDSAGFALRVKGAENVAELKAFYDALVAGDGIFAGLFYPDVHRSMTGVIIARESLLTPEARQAMVDAQVTYEADLRLLMASRADEVLTAVRKVRGRGSLILVHAWPVWTNGPDSEVRYAINPGRDVKARGGPYRFETLMDWVARGCKDELVEAPVVDVVATTEAPSV